MDNKIWIQRKIWVEGISKCGKFWTGNYLSIFFWFNKIIGQKCFGHKKLLITKFRSSKNVGQEAGAELGQAQVSFKLALH